MVGFTNALSAESLADKSLSFVILVFCALILSCVAAGVLCIAIIITTGKEVDVDSLRWIVLLAWLVSIIGIWFYFVKLVRAAESIELSTNKFFTFQVVAGAVVLFFYSMEMPYGDIGIGEGMRWVFDILVVLFNLSYLSFCIAARIRPELRAILGMACTFAIIMVPKLL